MLLISSVSTRRLEFILTDAAESLCYKIPTAAVEPTTQQRASPMDVQRGSIEPASACVPVISLLDDIPDWRSPSPPQTDAQTTS